MRKLPKDPPLAEKRKLNKIRFAGFAKKKKMRLFFMKSRFSFTWDEFRRSICSGRGSTPARSRCVTKKLARNKFLSFKDFRLDFSEDICY